MKQIDTIRAALEQAGEYIRSDLASERGAFEGHEGVSRIDEIKADLANNAAALAALAELERAAPEKSGSEAWLARYTAPPPAQPAMGMPEWYGMDTPWPLHDVLAKLIDATGVLLDRHSYDDHGHEGVRYAQLAGKEILANIFKDRTQ